MTQDRESYTDTQDRESYDAGRIAVCAECMMGDATGIVESCEYHAATGDIIDKARALLRAIPFHTGTVFADEYRALRRAVYAS